MSLLLRSCWIILVYQQLHYFQRLLPRLLWVSYPLSWLCIFVFNFSLCLSFNFFFLLWVGNMFKLFYAVQGYSEIKKRSLLTSMENYVTVLLEAGTSIYTPSWVPNSKFSYWFLIFFLLCKATFWNLKLDDLCPLAKVEYESICQGCSHVSVVQFSKSKRNFETGSDVLD